MVAPKGCKMVKYAKAPQRLITENMIRRMKLLIAEDKLKNRTELAILLEMPANSIYRMEKNEGFSFTLEQFYRFCKQFAIDPAELFPK